jgi:formylglycine-generating enzyme required for sulfatase activity
MGVFEITQAQYSNVVACNPAHCSTGEYAPLRPVEYLQWHVLRGNTRHHTAPRARSFFGILRAKTDLPFDVPTEAQWEYACRAGTTHALNNDTDVTRRRDDPSMSMLGRYWYNGGKYHRKYPQYGGTAPVGSYLPNQWGLYDMHGNVREWCADWYHKRAACADATDPRGPITGVRRVARGGDWRAAAWQCRSAKRATADPRKQSARVGFRLCLIARQDG